jgi:nitric oxide reductase large subunit
VYIASQKICFIARLQKSLIAAIGILVVDIMLLVSMLVGLLRHAHKSTTGLWHLLYQQVVAFPFSLYRMLTSAKCIVWIVVAAIAEVPVVVSLFMLLDNMAFMPTFFRSS